MTTTLEHRAEPSAERAYSEQQTAAHNGLAAEPALRISVTLELALYLLIAVGAAALLLTQLGAAPLNDAESKQALSALRVIDSTVPGEAPVAESPFSFALQVISLTFGGSSNAAARLPVALGALLLVISPALWRRYLNPLPTLVISALLAISPVVLLAGRTGSPVVWSALGAMVLPWCVLRAAETGRRGWMLAATALAVGMVLLAEPAGFLMLGGLGFGLFFAWLTDDDPETDLGGAVKRLSAAWPWADGAVVAGVLVVVVGTGFFFFPAGLTAVGAMVWDGLRGFVTTSDGPSLAFPLGIGLRYEGGLVLFGLLAVVQALRDGGAFERALAGWFLAGAFWSVAYSGATAAHALWLTLPLAALVGLQVTNWISEQTKGYYHAPEWAAYVMMAATAALWLVLGVSMILLGKRLLVDLPAGTTDLGQFIRTLLKGMYDSRITNTGTVELQGGYVLANTLGTIQFRLVVNLLIMMLIAVMYFMAASIWGIRVAWRGFALGTLAVMLLASLGFGVRGALDHTDDPRELWFRDPVTMGVDDISSTLREYSLRSTGTPHLIAVTAQVAPDGALGWALRDFDNVQFVSGVGPEVTSAAVIVPYSDPEPVFGADYVGKDVVTRLEWVRRGADGQESPVWRYGLMWLYRSASLEQPVASERLMIYLRADVYGVERVQ